MDTEYYNAPSLKKCYIVLKWFTTSSVQIKKEEGRIEKWVLRRAFDDEEHPYLPKVLLCDLQQCCITLQN